MVPTGRIFALSLAIVMVGCLAVGPPNWLHACTGCSFAFSSTRSPSGGFNAQYAVSVGVGPSGYMYVVNTVANRVEKFSPTGAYLTHWRCTVPNPSTVGDCSTIVSNGQFTVLATASIVPIIPSARTAASEKELSEVAEKYLETVYRLRETEGSARTGAIAEALGVTAGSVSPTIANLRSQGLVRRRKGHRGFELTPKGERVVMQILRKRRLAERLLTDVLGMSWTEVHETAARLAHGITRELAGVLEKVLKNPETCPHGNPIPNETGKIKQSKTAFLGQLNTGQQATLARVTIKENDLLRYLEGVGLVPGATICVEEKCPFDGALIVNVNGARVPIGKYVASSIRIMEK